MLWGARWPTPLPEFGGAGLNVFIDRPINHAQKNNWSIRAMSAANTGPSSWVGEIPALPGLLRDSSISRSCSRWVGKTSSGWAQNRWRSSCVQVAKSAAPPPHSTSGVAGFSFCRAGFSTVGGSPGLPERNRRSLSALRSVAPRFQARHSPDVSPAWPLADRRVPPPAHWCRGGRKQIFRHQGEDVIRGLSAIGFYWGSSSSLVGNEVDPVNRRCSPMTSSLDDFSRALPGKALCSLS